MTEKPSIEDVRALERFIFGVGATKHLLTFQGILRSHEEMHAALSTPPADDVRELVDHLNGLMDSLDDSVSHEQVYEQLRVAWEMARALRPGVDAPPAEDVREAQEVAMEREVTRILSRLAKRNDWAEDDTAIGGMAAHIVSVAIAAAAEVRPHGTVTDAEVQCPHWSPGSLTKRAGCTACAATEAAREVHP